MFNIFLLLFYIIDSLHKSQFVFESKGKILKRSTERVGRVLKIKIPIKGNRNNRIGPNHQVQPRTAKPSSILSHLGCFTGA